MKKLTLILTLVSTSLFGQYSIDKPEGLRTEKILVYLNSFEETTKLVNEEFERSNDNNVKEKRREALKQYYHSRYGKVENDTYAIAIEERIVTWINDNLRKVCQDLNDKKYVFVDSKTQDKYESNDWRYVLKFKYVFEKGDPLYSKMVFYFYDRKEDKEFLNTDSLTSKNSFNPLFYYTADKIYPFYGMIKSGRVKKEWEIFFKNL